MIKKNPQHLLRYDKIVPHKMIVNNIFFFWTTIWQCALKITYNLSLENEFDIDPVILLLEIYTRRKISKIFAFSPKLFLSVIFIIRKSWKYSKIEM